MREIRIRQKRTAMGPMVYVSLYDERGRFVCQARFDSFTQAVAEAIDSYLSRGHLTTRQISDQIWQGSWMTQGRAPTGADYTYWIAKWPELEARGVELGIPDYAFRRLLGKGATGADVPPYGEYANPPSLYRDVPPSPWADQRAPAPSTPPPASSPSTPAPPDDEDNGLDDLLTAVERIVAGVEQIVKASAATQAAVEQLAAKGVRVRF